MDGWMDGWRALMADEAASHGVLHGGYILTHMWAATRTCLGCTQDASPTVAKEPLRRVWPVRRVWLWLLHSWRLARTHLGVDGIRYLHSTISSVPSPAARFMPTTTYDNCHL